VKAPTEFWPVLHLLYGRLEAAGPTHEQRLAAVTESFAKMSAPVRYDLLRELRKVATTLNELEPMVFSEALHDSEGLPHSRGGLA
jgi:hypothetical protein